MPDKTPPMPGDFKLNDKFLNLPIWRQDEEDARDILDLMDEFSPESPDEIYENQEKFLNLSLLLALAARKEENGDIFSFRLQELGKRELSINFLLLTNFLCENQKGLIEARPEGPADVSTLSGWIIFLSEFSMRLSDPRVSMEFESTSLSSRFPDLIRYYGDFSSACMDLQKLHINSDVEALRSYWYDLDDRLDRISADYKFPPVFKELFTLIPQIKIINMLAQLILRELSFMQNCIYDEFAHDDNIDEYEKYMLAADKGCPCPAFMKNPLIRIITSNLQNTIVLRRSLGDKISKYITNPNGKRELREKEVTILFSDLREFTSLTEEFLKIEGSSSRPGGMNFLWNTIKSFMGRAAQIIEVHNFGWVDKFIGDAVMAVFGLEISSENKDRARSAVRALDSAFEIYDYVNTELKNGMLRYMKAGAQDPEQVLLDKIEALNSGFGLDYGTALFGEIGNNSRIDWTVLGNPVNTASRLEAKTRVMPGAILFTEDFLIKLIIESDLLSKKFTEICTSETETFDELKILSENQWTLFDYRIVFLRMVTLKGQTMRRRIYTAIRLKEENQDGDAIAHYNDFLDGFYLSQKVPDEKDIQEFRSFEFHGDLSRLEGWKEHFAYIYDKLRESQKVKKWNIDTLVTNFSEK